MCVWALSWPGIGLARLASGILRVLHERRSGGGRVVTMHLGLRSMQRYPPSSWMLRGEREDTKPRRVLWRLSKSHGTGLHVGLEREAARCGVGKVGARSALWRRALLAPCMPRTRWHMLCASEAKQLVDARGFRASLQSVAQEITVSGVCVSVSMDHVSVRMP